jgi:hypothetical protein
LWVLQVMETSGRDQLISHIFGSIRRSYEAGGDAWDGGSGPDEEMLATVGALHSICSSWREEVRVSDPKLRIGNFELALIFFHHGIVEPSSAGTIVVAKP